MSPNTFVLMKHTSLDKYKFTLPGTVWRILKNAPNLRDITVVGHHGSTWYIDKEDAIIIELSKLEEVIYDL